VHVLIKTRQRSLVSEDMKPIARLEVIVVNVEGISCTGLPPPLIQILHILLSSNLNGFAEVQRLLELTFIYDSPKTELRCS